MSATYPEAVRWSEDGVAVDLLDQRVLPERESRVRLVTAVEVSEAIRTMAVRGAPAIGVAAALGLAADAGHAATRGAQGSDLLRNVRESAELLRGARPTAVNLGWAMDRMLAVLERGVSDGSLPDRLRAEATAILEEDRSMCRRIGEHGQEILPDGDPVTVLTHCNAGALATSGMGTALAPVYVAAERGRSIRVFADETRPVLQGGRITAWELARAGIDVTLVVDSVAGVLLRDGRIDAVITGADRIAANGDVANKIGTYALAVLAREHQVPFYVAAPSSTLDPATPTGAQIPIEERDADEVRRGFGRLTAPADVKVYSPAFDVTPAELVSAFITDRGIIRPPYGPALARISGARG